MAQPFDDTAKVYYSHFFERQGMRAVSQVEVFSRSRAIDLVVECTEVDQAKLQQTTFEHLRRLNALEFKGYHDPLTPVDLNRIKMRAWGLGAIDDADWASKTDVARETILLTAQEIAEIPSQRTVTIICVIRPMKILDSLQHEFHFIRTNEQGVYCNNGREIPIWIIHPTELELKPKNYPLLPLARGTKLEQFIELCLQQGLLEYLQLTLDIGLVTDPDVIWRKILEVYGMELTIHEETWPYIDEFFRKVPEAMQKVPTFQEALEASEHRGAVHNQQQTLLLVLRHRFGVVPNRLSQLIEATYDLGQLAQWLEQALDANSLGAMDFAIQTSAKK
ncbi:MAG: hypothetical protein R3C14_42490 [Caldilineaceae bacterium]